MSNVGAVVHMVEGDVLDGGIRTGAGLSEVVTEGSHAQDAASVGHDIPGVIELGAAWGFGLGSDCAWRCIFGVEVAVYSADALVL